MIQRHVVRKLDTEDPFFYVVDTAVDGYVLISPASVVDRFRSQNDAYARAKELNAESHVDRDVH